MGKMKSGPVQKQGSAAPKVGGGTAPAYAANARTPVAKEFDRHPHVGAKKEKD